MRKTEVVRIENYNDYKDFGTRYCTVDKGLKNEYKASSFEFRFPIDALTDSAIRKGYEHILKKYTKTEFQTVVELTIKHNSDYSRVLDICDVSEKSGDVRIVCKNEYAELPCFTFVFSIPFEDNTDELLLHNYILLYLKKSEDITFKLKITTKKDSSNSMFFRVQTYLSGCSQELHESIAYNSITDNDSTSKWSAKSFGKILPAISIDNDMFQFLRAPLKTKFQDYILAPYGNDERKNPIDRKANVCQSQLLDACRRCLRWQRFDDHESKEYQAIREQAFETDDFKEYVEGMPFLALLLFAQFDYYYRSSIVSGYKRQIAAKKVALEKKDIIPELQRNQKYERFLAYKTMLRDEQTDVKSLIHKHGDDEILHKVVISELFEARTLAEGLLQLIENAVIHAKGGLLSIRIREYNPDEKNSKDTDFLINKYPKFFNNPELPPQCGQQFYLEVKLSDISFRDMKAKFVDNTENRARKLKPWVERFQEYSGGDIYKPFFEPSDTQEALWKEFYEYASNHVHHFGLQIFHSILNANGGALCVSGFKDVYPQDNPMFANAEADAELDTNMNGTSYRILLPLNRKGISNNNVIVDTSYDRVQDRDEVKDFEVYIVDRSRLADPTQPIRTKNEIIEIFTEEIGEKYEDGKNALLVLVFDKLLKYDRGITEECLIKSTLLFLLNLKSTPPPVAIIGLSSHSLLEVTRIIGLFYDKNGRTTSKMEKLQIYLKGNKIGEEILFAGSNISQTAERITRLALTRGISAEYISIAQSLMNREKHQE